VEIVSNDTACFTRPGLSIRNLNRLFHDKHFLKSGVFPWWCKSLIFCLFFSATIFNNANQHINVYGDDVEVDYKGYEVLRPRLFYLLDYRFLPQNVSEVGGEKNQKNFSVTRKYKSSPSAITAI
jgi:hypothetical protein